MAVRPQKMAVVERWPLVEVRLFIKSFIVYIKVIYTSNFLLPVSYFCLIIFAKLNVVFGRFFSWLEKQWCEASHKQTNKKLTNQITMFKSPNQKGKLRDNVK